MTGSKVDDVLRDLARELAIEPSPQLVSRIRARVYGSGVTPARAVGWPGCGRSGDGDGSGHGL